jgi:hypothetical protein
MSRKIHIIMSLSVLIFCLWGFLVQVQAAGPASNIEERLANTATQTGLKSEMSLSRAAGVVINVVTGFLGVAFFLLALYGGITWMTAGGDDKNLKKAQGILVDAAVGMGVVLIAYQVVQFVIKNIPIVTTPGTETEGQFIPTSATTGAPPTPGDTGEVPFSGQ